MKTSIIRKVLVALTLMICHQVYAHDFEVNGIYYGISLFNKNTAYVTHKGKDYAQSYAYSGSITIPDKVTYKGKTYTVATIGGYAFWNCADLKSVTLPNTITDIHQHAFEGCYGLETITIPASVKTIHDNAFLYCTGLTSVTSLNPTPPTCGTDVFKDVNVANIVLTVPAESISLYKAKTPWSNFKFEEQTEPEEPSVPEQPENPSEPEDPTEPELPTDNSGLSYNIINSTDVEVIAGADKYKGDIVIPSQTAIDGRVYNVTKIGNYAFDFCSGLTSITIPNSVTSIGYAAFYYCSGLTSVTIPNSVTSIGYAAFYYCSGLTSITIPNSVTSIGGRAFSGCSGLTSITIPNSVTVIGNEALRGCSGLTSIIVESGNTVYDSRDNCNAIIETSTNTLITGCKNTVIPNSVTSIGSSAFYYCSGLTSVTIPNSVTSIGYAAFYYCSGLTSITIPNSVTSIGDYAFSGCSGLTSITIPNSVTVIGNEALRGCSGLTSIIVESGNTVYDSRDNCNAIIETSTNTLITGCKNTVIPNSVTSIGSSAFRDCSGLTSITIPNSVTSIGADAFYYCSGLTSVTIPNSVTSIGGRAFEGCSGLTSVTIPNSVTSIGYKAFGYCSSLTSVISLNPTPPTCGTDVFESVNVGNITLEVPAESVSLYQSADTWKDFGTIKGIVEDEPELPVDTSGLSYNILNSTDVEVIAGAEKYTGDIVIPSQTTIDGKIYNVTKIGEKAFYECSGLTSITIPNSVTIIKYYAFYHCTGLISITIPNSVTALGEYVFKGCTGLKNITISNGLTSLYGEFDYCTGLTSVVIPNSVTVIGAAFQGCTGLTSVEIPNSVTAIYDFSFSGCTSLTSVEIPSNVSTIGKYVFSDCASLKSIIVEHENTKYDSRDNCNAIIETSTNTLVRGCENTIIPNSISSIGHSAFYGCTSMTSITIPNSVTSIGEYAFRNCSSMTHVEFPKGVTSIGESAFRDCSGLTSVTSLSITPPSCGTNVFYNVSVGVITLEVPSESVSLYQSANTWKDFGTIKGIEDAEPELPTDNSGLSYKILNSTDVEVIAGAEKYTGDIVIPSQTTIDGKVYNVTKIGNSAFYRCSGLTSVTIPNSVTGIGDKAFEDCTNLTSIEIPNSVTIIGDNAFYNCSGLTSVNISDLEAWCKIDFVDNDSNPLTYAKNLYLNGEFLTNIEIPNTITEIKNFAFYGCSGLTSVTIPNSVTSIGYFAFEGCSGLTSVTIPNSVTSIRYYAFQNCSGLTSIVVESGNTVYDSRNNCNAIIETSTNTLITGCKNTVIPNSITSIGYAAFADCSGLTSVTIPNSVTSIGDNAFDGCSGLTSVTIPNSVTSIGSYAFSGCSGLTSIIVESGNTVYDSRDNCNAIIKTSTNTLITGCKNTVIPNSVTNIGDYAFSGCSSLTSITIPNSVTSIGYGPFNYCSGLTSIIVESGNTVYDSRDNCNAIIATSTNTLITGCKNTIIPEGVTSIGSSAFYYCSGLTSATIPESVTSIGAMAFYGCSGLTSVTIPNSVTSIGNYAFLGCSGLTSITIPHGVTSIGINAFYNCSGLTSVTSLNPTPPACGSKVFENVIVGNITLEVPAESVSLYQSADTWKDFGTIKAVSSSSRSESSGIDDIFGDGDEVEYYTLQGVKVVNPAHGLYIKKQGNKVTKVVL